MSFLDPATKSSGIILVQDWGKPCGPVTYFIVATREIRDHGFAQVESADQPTTNGTLGYIFAGWRHICYPECGFYPCIGFILIC